MRPRRQVNLHRRLLRAACSVAALGCTCLAFAVGALAAAPSADVAGDAEQLIAPLPPDWRISDRMAHGDLRQMEYLPAPTASRADDESIHIETMRTEPQPTLDEFLALYVEAVRRDCPGLQVSRMFDGRENGYPTAVRLIDCPRGPGSGTQLTMLKSIRGDNWLYLIVRRSSRADTRPDRPGVARCRPRLRRPDRLQCAQSGRSPPPPVAAERGTAPRRRESFRSGQRSRRRF